MRKQKIKKGTAAAKKFMAKVRAAKKSSLRQTGTSNKKKDKLVQAKKPGKRISTNNSVYYERRENRSDKGRLLGMKDISLNAIGAELYELESKISALMQKRKLSKTAAEKKEINTKLAVLKAQFKALRAYLNTRARFI